MQRDESESVPGSRHYVGVIGPDAPRATATDLERAREVGGLLARHGVVIVCGGLGGVMEAVCLGARREGGDTVGLLPGEQRDDGNVHLSIAIPTGLGELRNGLVVRASDSLICIGRSWGTLSEVALALRRGRRVVFLGSWSAEEIEGLADPTAADLVCESHSAEDAVATTIAWFGSVTDDPADPAASLPIEDGSENER